jgi:hypothetical protein
LGLDAGAGQVAGIGWDAGTAGRHSENDEQGAGSLPTRARMGRKGFSPSKEKGRIKHHKN